MARGGDIVPPALVDIGTDADAGFRLAALPYARFVITEYRPHGLQVPTLASGIEAQPPAGTSAAWGTERINPVRMAGNGETHSCDDAGDQGPHGLGFAPPVGPFHSLSDSHEERDNHACQ
jgi:hypothetical protein